MNVIIAVIVCLIIAAGVFFYFRSRRPAAPSAPSTPAPQWDGNARITRWVWDTMSPVDQARVPLDKRPL